MKRRIQPQTMIFYMVYVVLWCFIITFILKNIIYGTFNSAVVYYGTPVIWIWGLMAVTILIMATTISTISFAAWFLMMYFAVTAK